MSAGDVYILINPAMPDIVKIGKTTRNVHERVRELSAATGIPQNFILVYHRHFANVDRAEAVVHTTLEAQGVRTSPNREFFRLSPTDAINALLGIAAEGADVPFEQTPEIDTDARRVAAMLIDEGEDHLYGEISNPFKAAACFEKAMKLGSAVATAKLGELYLDRSLPITNVKSGERLLLDAASRGVPEALSELANFYHREERPADSRAMWIQLLTQHRDEPARSMARMCVGLTVHLYDGYRDSELINLLRPYRVELLEIWDGFIRRELGGYENRSRLHNQRSMLASL